MRANACFGTRFLTRVCAKIVRAFCVCVGRLSLTCTVFTNIETSHQRGLGKKGKAAFREAFGRVAELRSCLETGMPLLGLTATANKEMRERLTKCLGLKTSNLITVSPNKDNIRFSVLQADKQLHCFNWLLSLLRNKKENTPFTIIFCKTVNDIVSLLTFFFDETWKLRPLCRWRRPNS